MAQKEEEKLYDKHDRRPYYVHISGENLNRIKIGNIINKNKINNIIETKKVNKNCIKIRTIDKIAGNKLVKMTWEDSVKAFIPDYYQRTYGVINGIPLDMSEEEILMETVCERGQENIIEKIERINRWNTKENTIEPSKSVK